MPEALDPIVAADDEAGAEPPCAPDARTRVLARRRRARPASTRAAPPRSRRLRRAPGQRCRSRSGGSRASRSSMRSSSTSAPRPPTRARGTPASSSAAAQARAAGTTALRATKSRASPTLPRLRSQSLDIRCYGSRTVGADDEPERTRDTPRSIGLVTPPVAQATASAPGSTTASSPRRSSSARRRASFASTSCRCELSGISSVVPNIVSWSGTSHVDRGVNG